MSTDKIKTLSSGHREALFICILSGIALGLSFPKAGLWPLGWVSLVGLFRVIEGRSFRESFSLGFVFGWVFFFFTQHWINNSIHYYGGVPLVAGLGIVGLLCAYEAVYTGVFAWLSADALKRDTIWDFFFIGALWVGLEYLRGVLFTGFPWSLLGYSQTGFLPLMQVADITGVYGVSFVLILGNLLIYGMLFKGWKIKRAIVFVLLIAVAIVYGFIRYEMLKEIKTSKTLKVAMVQPNVDQSVKWDPQYRKQNLNKLFALTMTTLRKKPELVIWPETALPFYFGIEANWTVKLQQFITENRLTLLTGAPLIQDIKKKDGFYQYITSNSAILIGPDGNLLGSYDKIHLVPFGEYVPLKKILFFVERLAEGIGDFRRGDSYTVFEINGKRFFVLICYEAIFPALVRSFGEADFMVNITNDAWFGTTSGPYQHADIARVRAIEMRRPIVRVANTGISEVVDITGEVIKKTTLNTQWTGVVEVPLKATASVYQQIGDLFSYLMLAVACISILLKKLEKTSGG
jgi:apolipoprotein N-acyltransferase